MSKKHTRDEESDPLSPQVHEALGELGWLPPETERDVQRAEQRTSDQTLPETLRDPRAVFDRTEEPPPATIPFPIDPDIDATLARAAREGGHLTPEIEEIMRRDRQAAEREADHGPKAE